MSEVDDTPDCAAEPTRTETMYIVLPGKYSFVSHLGDYSVTVTFQTLEELRAYIKEEQSCRSSLDP